MDSSSDQIVKEILPFIRIHKDGRFEKLSGTNTVPAGFDPSSGVRSKDVVISPDTPLSVRIYIPNPQSPDIKNSQQPYPINTALKKLPTLIYFHGGGFIIESAASPRYHNFLNLIVAESGAIVVSVDYRTAPEHPIPACFDDSWEAVKWVALHLNGNGPESWLNEFADIGNVFFAGDSAGANIAHHMAIRVRSENLTRILNLRGVILLHPYFLGKERVGSEQDDIHVNTRREQIWKLAHPGTSGLDDPWINPAMDPKLWDLGCSKVLVYVAENDGLRERGYYYKEILEKSGWSGEIEVVEDKGVGHVYFLLNPFVDGACTLRTKICTFINDGA